MPVIPAAAGSFKIGELPSKLAWAEKQNLISKITRAKRAGGVTQVVECLPSKCKVPSSNSSSASKSTLNPVKQ
jgi:hypothetical protein